MNWNQPEKHGKEPERPAPVLEFAKATGDKHGGDDASEPADASTATDTSGPDPLARVLGAVAVAVVALVAAVLVRRRRTTTP